MNKHLISPYVFPGIKIQLLPKKALQRLKRNPIPLDGFRVRKIIEDYFGFEPGELSTKCNKKQFVWPRQLYFFFARKDTNLSLESIAYSVGKRDHNNVQYGISKVVKETEEDINKRRQFNELEGIIFNTKISIVDSI